MKTKYATEIMPNDWIFVYDFKLKKYIETLVSKVIDLDTIQDKPIEHHNSFLFVSASFKQYIIKKDQIVNFIKSEVE